MSDEKLLALKFSDCKHPVGVTPIQKHISDPFIKWLF